MFHANGILPDDLVVRNVEEEKFIDLRRKLLEDQLSYHQLLLNEISGKKVIIGLENAPIWDAAIRGSQWFSEHAFEDFESRLILGGVHTIDIPHTAMNSAYYSQSERRFFSMEMIRGEFSGVPASLRSVGNYIKVASEFFRKVGRSSSEITYHIADCNGLYGNNEGVIIGAEGSVINWKDAINSIRKYTPGSYGAIEVQNGHLKENYDSHIRMSLKNLLSFV